MQATIKNVGLFFPRKHIVINLPPASVCGEGQPATCRSLMKSAMSQP
jgi:predicted ATPase with chaperone activity